MKAKTILGIGIVLILISVLFTGCSVTYPASGSVNQLPRTSHYLEGSIMKRGELVSGADVLVYLEKNPNKIITTTSGITSAGRYSIDLESLHWLVGDTVIVKASKGGYAGENSLIIDNVKTQTINVNIDVADFKEASTSQKILIRIFSGTNQINTGYVVLFLGEDYERYIFDLEQDELGYFEVDIADFEVPWFVGERATVQYYFSNTLVAQEIITVGGDGAQFFDFILLPRQ